MSRFRARFSRFALLAFFALTAQFASAQQTTPTVQRDPQALTLLNQVLNAAGGASAVNSIQDFTGTGSITYQWAGEAVSGQAIVYGKVPNQFRMDSNVSSGTQSFIINGGVGSLIPLNRQKTMLSPYSIMNAANMAVPIAKVPPVLSNSSTSVEYVGLVSWNASQVHQVHIAPVVDAALAPSNAFNGLGSFDLYIDPVSYQIAGLGETVWWGGDPSHPYRHELIFSNYGKASSLTLAFTFTEKFAGQQTWSLTLTSISFNTGLSDSLFTP